MAAKKYLLSTEIKKSLDTVLSENPTAYYKELKRVETELIGEIESRRKAFNSKYTYCHTCKKYYLKKDEKKESVKETHHGVCVYTDCGYGDDDEYADVTYLVTYSICPLCKKYNEQLSAFTLRETNRRNRWGDRR